MDSGEPTPTRKSKSGRPLKPTARFSPVLGNSSYAGEWITSTVEKKRGQVSVPPTVPEELGATQDGATSCSSKTLEVPDAVDSRSGEEGVTKDDPAAAVVAPAGPTPEVTVEVPSFRIVNMEKYFREMVIDQGPMDDMSEEAFERRHKKLELEEKRMKRRYIQAQKEQAYKERMLKKEEERRKKKELKHQPRKQKGTQPEPVEPEPPAFTNRMEDALAIHVCREEELPPQPENFSLEKVPV